MITRDVSAALIADGDRFLICQRPEYKARGLLWEFVGGKVEPGESAEEALVRECLEELDITVEPERVLMEVVHQYPDIRIRLILFRARIVSGEIRLLEHAAMAWIKAEETDRYEFCPADQEILEALRNGLLSEEPDGAV